MPGSSKLSTSSGTRPGPFRSQCYVDTDPHRLSLLCKWAPSHRCFVEAGFKPASGLVLGRRPVFLLVCGLLLCGLLKAIVIPTGGATRNLISFTTKATLRTRTLDPSPSLGVTMRPWRPALNVSRILGRAFPGDRRRPAQKVSPSTPRPTSPQSPTTHRTTRLFLTELGPQPIRRQTGRKGQTDPVPGQDDPRG